MTNLEAIYNFAQVSEQIATSGQPKAEQFDLIKAAGYQVVVNLASGTTKYDLPDEATIVKNLDLEYHHIPVDWENPRMSDLEAFFTVMDANQDKPVFVHCIANYRVSAFVMLYRVIKQGIALADAQALKAHAWNLEEAVPTWDDFIALALKQHGVED